MTTAEKIIEARKAGVTYARIADDVGCHLSAVKQMVLTTAPHLHERLRGSREEMVRLSRVGQDAQQIADTMGVSALMVERLLNKAAAEAGCTPYDPAQALRLYRHGGVTYNELGILLGINPYILRRDFTHLGLRLAVLERTDRLDRCRAELRERLDRGEDFYEVVEDLDVPTKEARRICLDILHKRKPKRAANTRPRLYDYAPIRAKIDAEKAAGTYSPGAVAREFGVSKAQLSYIASVPISRINVPATPNFRHASNEGRKGHRRLDYAQIAHDALTTPTVELAHKYGVNEASIRHALRVYAQETKTEVVVPPRAKHRRKRADPAKVLALYPAKPISRIAAELGVCEATVDRIVTTHYRAA